MCVLELGTHPFWFMISFEERQENQQEAGFCLLLPVADNVQATQCKSRGSTLHTSTMGLVNTDQQCHAQSLIAPASHSLPYQLFLLV